MFDRFTKSIAIIYYEFLQLFNITVIIFRSNFA
jgi:hypothetical protein